MDNCKRLTIGIYGIQDLTDDSTPVISHDHNITVMCNGKIISHLHLEREDRKKHSKGMPEAIYTFLKKQKLLKSDNRYVFVDNILGRSFINTQGNIRFEAPLNNSLMPSVEKGRMWLFDREIEAFVINHELAHIGSCLPFFGDFKDNSLLVHFDGGASKSNFSAWVYKQGKLKEIEHHWNLKRLSSLFNANALVFALVGAKKEDLNSVPGKFMGLASYGNYNENILKWLKRNDFFENIWSKKSVLFNSIEQEFGYKKSVINNRDLFFQDIAHTIHKYFTDEIIKEFERLKDESGAEYLYYSGGTALNILLNTMLVESQLFRDVFIPPNCNDSGLSMGAAALCEWFENKHINIHSPYINNVGIEDYKVDFSNGDIVEIATLLKEGKTVGVANGYGEVGPRALGNRSILCMASSEELAKKVSMIMKKREWYRPVAPIMLEKNAKYFTGLSSIHHLAKYMLIEFNVLKDKQQEIAGAVHIDGTARIQVIFEKDDNPFMYNLLSYLDRNYGIRALINTSFNVRGEPIVHTEDDALQSAKNMGLDAVVLNTKLHLIKNL